MKKYTLNIGLNIGDRADALTLSRVTLAVERAIEPHGRILSLNVHRSSSENTAVVVVEGVDLAGRRWWHLASELEQEAVSVWDEDRATGFLYGPEAVRWGLFNPEYFLLPDGLPMNAERPTDNASDHLQAMANVDELVEAAIALMDDHERMFPEAHPNSAIEWNECEEVVAMRAALAKFGK